MKIVGVKHMMGEFEDKVKHSKIPFDNYYLYGTDDDTNNDNVQYYGTCPNCIKVKASVLHQVVAADKIEKLIGRSVECFYDSYKNVALVNVK